MIPEISEAEQKKKDAEKKYKIMGEVVETLKKELESKEMIEAKQRFEEWLKKMSEFNNFYVKKEAFKQAEDKKEQLKLDYEKLQQEERDIKGKYAESMFKEWLDKNNIPFFYIQQDLKTFSQPLKKYYDAKRNDFIVLIPNLGFITVDVKYRTSYSLQNKPIFWLDFEDVEKLSNLQKRFKLDVYLALSNEKCDTWYWIPIEKVEEKAESKKEDHYEIFADKFPFTIKPTDSVKELTSKIIEMK